jgi:hypothetical protein
VMTPVVSVFCFAAECLALDRYRFRVRAGGNFDDHVAGKFGFQSDTEGPR